MNKKLRVMLVLTLTSYCGIVIGQPNDNVQVDQDGFVKHVPLWLVKASYFPANTTKVTEWNINALEAYAVAYKALQQTSDLPAQRKRLSNYLGVYMSEDANNYYIFFLSRQKVAHVSPNYTVADGETYFGANTRYTITKSDYRIVERKFYLM